jgi:hypothetical protein
MHFGITDADQFLFCFLFRGREWRAGRGRRLRLSGWIPLKRAFPSRT